MEPGEQANNPALMAAASDADLMLDFLAELVAFTNGAQRPI
jgi:hypothetical protein